MVEVNDKQCEVRQEEENTDYGIKVGLSCIDHRGARRCAITGILVGNACSTCCGTSTPSCERLHHQGAVMVKFKG